MRQLYHFIKKDKFGKNFIENENIEAKRLMYIPVDQLSKELQAPLKSKHPEFKKPIYFRDYDPKLIDKIRDERIRNEIEARKKQYGDF